MYTFDSFVVGNCNEFAHAAAMAVSENLGGSYNPLFVYAGVGLGKTHLISSIGHRVLLNNPTKNIYFTTSEEFTNEMISSIQHDKMIEFRNKYRNVDLLLIDDIQFLAKKERTQEEFFHTFNSIYENRKQIVITSDRFPNEINDMEERLKSRFQWGLIADMAAPDLETRVAILKRKAYEDAAKIPDEVALFLAEQATSNIRELVGALIRLVAMSSLQGKPITLDLAENCFKERLNKPPKQVTIDSIIKNISNTFNVKASDIKSKKKHKMYSRPRQVAMYLARELTQLSYPEIGEAFGGKDHSTVIYATRKIERQLKDDSQLQSQIDVLKKEINGK
jgi:chromosomal replication initiator protein